jgi:hypothetical protein
MILGIFKKNGRITPTKSANFFAKKIINKKIKIDFEK